MLSAARAWNYATSPNMISLSECEGRQVLLGPSAAGQEVGIRHGRTTNREPILVECTRAFSGAAKKIKQLSHRALSFKGRRGIRWSSD